MFEHRSKPLLPLPLFYRRLARSLCLGLLVIVFALGVGMIGYRSFEPMSWVDAFVNAAMILSGMGPMSPLHTNAAKLFAGCYAIYCGIALIATTGVILAPVIHRALHKFHLEDESQG